VTCRTRLTPVCVVIVTSTCLRCNGAESTSFSEYSQKLGGLTLQKYNK